MTPATTVMPPYSSRYTKNARGMGYVAAGGGGFTHGGHLPARFIKGKRAPLALARLPVETQKGLPRRECGNPVSIATGYHYAGDPCRQSSPAFWGSSRSLPA